MRWWKRDGFVWRRCEAKLFWLRIEKGMVCTAGDEMEVMALCFGIWDIIYLAEKASNDGGGNATACCER